jgi:hypothetical protein
MRRSRRFCTIPAKSVTKVARQMEASNAADDFIPAALAAYGVEADEIELAVMRAAHQTFWPPILELLALDTSAVAAERDSDLSQAPPSR